MSRLIVANCHGEVAERCEDGDEGGEDVEESFLLGDVSEVRVKLRELRAVDCMYWIFQLVQQPMQIDN